jgi:hypothetical protein
LADTPEIAAAWPIEQPDPEGASRDARRLVRDGVDCALEYGILQP